MGQLKMLWRPTNGGCYDYHIPEDITIRPMQFEEIEQWINTANEFSRHWNNDSFVQTMLFGPPLPLSPKHIICAYNSEGKMIATASACIDPIKKLGDLHMVQTNTEYRGKNIGKGVCAECVKLFEAAGVQMADLSTDEWRKPAIAIYLKLGFRPYMYEDGMEERWYKTLQEMDWKKEVLAYDKDKRDIFFCNLGKE